MTIGSVSRYTNGGDFFLTRYPRSSDPPTTMLAPLLRSRTHQTSLLGHGTRFWSGPANSWGELRAWECLTIQVLEDDSRCKESTKILLQMRSRSDTVVLEGVLASSNLLLSILVEDVKERPVRGDTAETCRLPPAHRPS